MNYKEWRDRTSKGTGRIRSKELKAVDEADLLFPPRQQGEIAKTLTRLGVDTRLEMLPSPQGHDAFLVDFRNFGNVVGGYLGAIAKRELNTP